MCVNDSEKWETHTNKKLSYCQHTVHQLRPQDNNSTEMTSKGNSRSLNMVPCESLVRFPICIP